MIIHKVVKLPNQSSIVSKLRANNIDDINGEYFLSIEKCIELFPKSNTIRVEYLCNQCNDLQSLSINSWTQKKNKDVCGHCLKTKILVGCNSSAFGKSYTKGIPKSEEHKRKLSKSRPQLRGPQNPNWKQDTPEFKRYKGRVHQLSQKIYVQNISIINPHNYPRTRCGIEGGYQLDHKKSIRQCFNEGLTVEQASSKENLQLLPWKENLLKSIG